jgi:hypothetical protein
VETSINTVAEAPPAEQASKGGSRAALEALCLSQRAPQDEVDGRHDPALAVTFEGTVPR